LRRRSIVGIGILAAGVIMVALSTYNLYTLLFVANMTKQNDIPIYTKLVLTPILLGVILMVDGSVISGLSIPFPAVLYAVGNAFWIYASIQVRDLLSIPILKVQTYHDGALFFIASGAFLLAGAISNHILEARYK